MIFFGAGADLAHAFELSLVQLSALAVGIVVMTRLLPHRHTEPDVGAAPVAAPPAVATETPQAAALAPGPA